MLETTFPIPPLPSHPLQRSTTEHVQGFPAAPGSTLGVSKQQMPGQQWAARVQGKKRGGGLGGALGRGFPSHCVHAAFGGPGALSPSEPLSDGAFPVPGRLGGGQGVQAREEARQPTCPGSSLQGALPWAHVAWSFPFGDDIREAGAHPKPLSSQRHSRWETEEKLGASRKVLSSLGRERGISFQRIKRKAINP